jgi:hypothetical protein
MNQPEQHERLASLEIVKGQVRAFFAFDIGYEVSLEKVSQLLDSNPKQPLSRTKRTPNYLQYTHVPHVLSLGEAEICGHWIAEMEATIFDFGAVSIAYRWELPVRGEEMFRFSDLPAMSEQLYHCDLESHAREQLKILTRRIESAIIRPELSELVEDYYIFIIQEFQKPIQADALLADYSATLAQVLQFDTKPLSEGQRQAALANAISYYDRDLVLIDWNASIIYDADYSDTLNVLELLNVELLEARYMDAQLDKRIKNYEGLSQKQPAWFMPLSIPYRQAINELAELRIESSVLAERVDNALKLIGDLYLARVYSAASEQFYMPTWDASISRKLDIIGNLYQLLTDRVNSSQAQMLELVIILLIAIEIFLSLSHQ